MKNKSVIGILCLLMTCSLRGMHKEDFFTQLPIELHGEIVKRMVGSCVGCVYENKILYKKFFDGLKDDTVARRLSLHVLLGHKFVNDLYSIEKLCKKKIGNKSFLGLEMAVFALSQQERIALQELANTNFFNSYAVEEEIYATISAIKNKEIAQNLSVPVVPNNKVVRNAIKLSNIAGALCFAGALCLGISWLFPKDTFISFKDVAGCGVLILSTGTLLFVGSSEALKLYALFFSDKKISVKTHVL